MDPTPDDGSPEPGQIHSWPSPYLSDEGTSREGFPPNCHLESPLNFHDGFPPTYNGSPKNSLMVHLQPHYTPSLTGRETGHTARRGPRAPANRQRLPVPPTSASEPRSDPVLTISPLTERPLGTPRSNPRSRTSSPAASAAGAKAPATTSATGPASAAPHSSTPHARRAGFSGKQIGRPPRAANVSLSPPS